MKMFPFVLQFHQINFINEFKIKQMTFKKHILIRTNRISQTFTGHVNLYSCELKTKNISMCYQLPGY